MSNLLGDFAYYFGPKVILDLIIMFNPICISTVKLLFVYASKHIKKYFYWLEAMEFNPVNRSFDKLDLNENESKNFVKRLSLSIFLLKSFVCFIIAFFFVLVFVLTFKLKDDYHLNYLISLVLYIPQIYLNVYFIFGFLVLLYLVS